MPRPNLELIKLSLPPTLLLIDLLPIRLFTLFLEVFRLLVLGGLLTLLKFAWRRPLFPLFIVAFLGALLVDALFPSRPLFEFNLIVSSSDLSKSLFPFAMFLLWKSQFGRK